MSKQLKTLINEDLYRYGVKKLTLLKLLRFLCFDDIKRFIILWRIGNWAYLNNHKFLEIFIKLILKLNVINHLSEIPVRTIIGGGFFIQHFSGITINVKSKIGKNVHIHKGVTIGESIRGNKKGVPTIGDNVWIGINSTIVGGITIGSNVLIAANSFVNIDVPNNSIVFGNPAIIKYKEDAVEGYIGNRI